MKNKLISFVLGYESSEENLRNSKSAKAIGHTFTSIDVSGKAGKLTNTL